MGSQWTEAFAIADAAISFDQEQWQAIEAYQRLRRISTMTESVRALVWRGLEAEGAAPPTAPRPEDEPH
jgi:hypothetical protein